MTFSRTSWWLRLENEMKWNSETEGRQPFSMLKVFWIYWICLALSLVISSYALI